MSAEQQLLGCVLHAVEAPVVLDIARVVPDEAFEETLDRAIFAAAVDLARAGQWDIMAIPARVHTNGYPRDLHGTVTGRVISLRDGCAFPWSWRPVAAEVREVLTRRRVAVAMARLEKVLPTVGLDEIASALAATAHMANTAAGINQTLTRGEPG